MGGGGVQPPGRKKVLAGNPLGRGGKVVRAAKLDPAGTRKYAKKRIFKPEF